VRPPTSTYVPAKPDAPCWGEKKAARKAELRDRRASFLRCNQCAATGTVEHDDRRIHAMSLPFKRLDDGRFEHVGCGGHLVALDIKQAT
jgi:hypothetical protein